MTSLWLRDSAGNYQHATHEVEIRKVHPRRILGEGPLSGWLVDSDFPDKMGPLFRPTLKEAKSIADFHVQMDTVPRRHT